MEVYHQRIKELRANSDVTLKEMAKLIGVSEATVQRYESGVIHDLPYSVITAYAKKFGVKPEYIMGWTDTKETVVTQRDKDDALATLDRLKEYVKALQKMHDEVDDKEKRLIEHYRQLNPDAQKRVLKYVDMELGD